MPPWHGGGAMIDRVTFEKTTFAPAPQRFEAGTPMIVEALGMAAAMDWLSAIGLARAERHERDLAFRLRDELRKRNDVTLFGPEDSVGIVSFALDGVHPHDLCTLLEHEGPEIEREPG